jgi:hypothetical protein
MNSFKEMNIWEFNTETEEKIQELFKNIAPVPLKTDKGKKILKKI